MSETTPEPLRVQVEFTAGDDPIVRALRQAIRVRGGDVRTRLNVAREIADPPNWVLVKGYHDSGTIDGVYGPYTEAYTDWLLTTVLDCSSYNWTKVKLSSGPEEP